MPNIEENPDFQLLKQFLQSINPNDMDEASAKELMDLGKMIQNGGALTDRQREMFASVVGAMPDMRAQTGAAMTEAEMPDMGMQTGAAMTEAEMEEMRMQEFNRKLKEQQEAAFNARQREIQAGNLPTGPAAGMTEIPSQRPPMRPSNLGGR